MNRHYYYASTARAFMYNSKFAKYISIPKLLLSSLSSLLLLLSFLLLLYNHLSLTKTSCLCILNIKDLRACVSPCVTFVYICIYVLPFIFLFFQCKYLCHLCNLLYVTKIMLCPLPPPPRPLPNIHFP